MWFIFQVQPNFILNRLAIVFLVVINGSCFLPPPFLGGAKHPSMDEPHHVAPYRPCFLPPPNLWGGCKTSIYSCTTWHYIALSIHFYIYTSYSSLILATYLLHSTILLPQKIPSSSYLSEGNLGSRFCCLHM